jgi:hypothetical protein
MNTARMREHGGARERAPTILPSRGGRRKRPQRPPPIAPAGRSRHTRGMGERDDYADHDLPASNDEPADVLRAVGVYALIAVVLIVLLILLSDLPKFMTG